MSFHDVRSPWVHDGDSFHRVGNIGWGRAGAPGITAASTPRMRAVLERVDARQRPANGQLMDGLGPLVRDDALEVEHVPDGHILGADARATQHVARIAGDIECHAAVVPLG